MMKRSDILQTLQQQPAVDVLVIGGGINGAGTFRDLALQGVRVLLVDKGDFCAGASAASSHMLHGGIRYLENGEFRLVREALHERNLLLKNAPHYAKPLPTTIPIFRWFSGLFNAPLKFLNLRDKPGERGAVVIKLGLMMYDAFTGAQQSMPFHKVRTKEDALREYPQMSRNIVATATYYDAWMPSPERLCLELILDAEASSPQAFALNYVSATGGSADSVLLTDTLTGDTFSVQPKVVINAAGPWIDFVNHNLHSETRFIGGTKGSHLVVEHPELLAALNGHEVFFENADGRIVLLFPYLNRVMIGTTDIRIDDPEQAVCTEDEVDYMLKLVSRVFPGIHVPRSAILFRFCGVRPLPASEAGRTGAISRDHSIRTLAADETRGYPVHSLIGGKWTTFRAFSEQAADTALRDLKQRRRVSTERLPIGGGDNYPVTDGARALWLKTLQQQTELPLAHLERLLERYGTYAAVVAQFISAENDAPLTHAPDYTRREIMFLTAAEKTETSADVLLRRSLLGMLGYVTPALLEEIVSIIAAVKGWSPSQAAADLERTRALFIRQHGLAVADPA
ncbi:MAG: glycerol-3-phosphate dehydrogenase/oxidase [Anaerolineae bacterium]|nr:glycerol-3-phosphate dehydrogenase/oxidase [Anaerolineae bacterium]